MSFVSLRILLPLLLIGCQLERGDRYDPFVDRAPPQAPSPSEPEPSPEAREPIVREKELLIVHRSVLLDRRAIDGTWSFEHFVPDPSAWLASFAATTAVGPGRAPVTPRPKPALRFRLIAIVNRFDIDELRFVYTAVDPKTDKATPMTVIIESRIGSCAAPGWHALGKQPFGDAFNASLEALTLGATALRLRTNERIDDGSWELREFDGKLTPAPLVTTPRLELNRSPSLDSWIKENEAAVERSAFTLPSSFQAGAAIVPERAFRWQASESFNQATCNGCHGVTNALPFQHLAAPDQPREYYANDDGETRVSGWLKAELTRREVVLRDALTKGCY